MKNLPAALQTLIDADEFHPVVAVTIVLRDNATTLRIANRAVTLGGNLFTGDLIDLPKISVSSGSGIDHTVISVSNADNTFSAYELDDDYDGARCTVESYFATDSTYTVFEGPVLNFSGVVSEPVLYKDRIQLTVMSDSRLTSGTIGRTITNNCLHEFRSSNCGYTHSAVVKTAGTVSTIEIKNTAVAGQDGIAMRPINLGTPGAAQNAVGVFRSGVQQGADAYITATNLEAGTPTITLSSSFAVQVDDEIRYLTCPRDSMENCARRWRMSDSTPQQDRFLGFDYYRDEQILGADDNQGVMIRYGDLVDKIIPIAYGERWVEPLLIQAHSSSGDDEWSSYNTTKVGPFVVGLISEGPVDTGIVDQNLDVMLDNELLNRLPNFADGSIAVRTSLGGTTPTISDFAPSWTNEDVDTKGLPGMSGMPNVAYFIIDLPDSYDLTPQSRSVVRTINPYPNGRFIWGNKGTRTIKTFSEGKRPDVRIKYKGKKVQTWITPSNPVKGAITYSRNPVWQILDLISAPQRVDTDDIYSGRIAESDIDHASFIEWADYADESITQYDSKGTAGTVARYVSDIYIDTENRRDAVEALLQVCRGSLIEKDGKIGITCDAPVGGQGIVTSTTSNTLTDSSRDGVVLPTWPTGGASGQLVNLKVEILGSGYGGSGTGSGQVFDILSNTNNQITIDGTWSPQPSGAAYIVYAMELNTDRVGDMVLKRGSPTHSLSNEIIATFNSNEFDGREGTVTVRDTREDDFNQTYIDRFGLNSQTVEYKAISSYGLAVRTSWYNLRKSIDQNRVIEISNVNVEGLALEVGDVVSLSHEVGQITKDLWRVEQKVSKGETTFDLTVRLFRDLVHLDWPTDNFDGLEIRSRVRAAHSLPPHIKNLSLSVIEGIGVSPVIRVNYAIPQWEFDGSYVVIEASTDAGGTFNEVQRSQDESRTSFIAQAGRDYLVRAIFVSHTRTRADGIIRSGSATGGGNNTLADTSRVSDVDYYTGFTMILRPGVGQEVREITSNTATEYTVDTNWTVNPSVSDDYTIFNPAPEATIKTAISDVREDKIRWVSEEKLTPSDPTGLSVSEGGTENTVEIDWTDNADDEITYEVWRSPDDGSGGGGAPTGVWVQIDNSPYTAPVSTPVTDSDTTTLSTASLWWYRVRARSKWAYSAYTAAEQVDLSLS